MPNWPCGPPCSCTERCSGGRTALKRGHPAPETTPMRCLPGRMRGGPPEKSTSYGPVMDSLSLSCPPRTSAATAPLHTAGTQWHDRSSSIERVSGHSRSAALANADQPDCSEPCITPVVRHTTPPHCTAPRAEADSKPRQACLKLPCAATTALCHPTVKISPSRPALQARDFLNPFLYLCARTGPPLS
jgi:hypothetical protein